MISKVQGDKFILNRDFEIDNPEGLKFSIGDHDYSFAQDCHIEFFGLMDDTAGYRLLFYLNDEEAVLHTVSIASFVRYFEQSIQSEHEAARILTNFVTQNLKLYTTGDCFVYPTKVYEAIRYLRSRDIDTEKIQLQAEIGVRK